MNELCFQLTYMSTTEADWVAVSALGVVQQHSEGHSASLGCSQGNRHGGLGFIARCGRIQENNLPGGVQGLRPLHYSCDDKDCPAAAVVGLGNPHVTACKKYSQKFVMMALNT